MFVNGSRQNVQYLKRTLKGQTMIYKTLHRKPKIEQHIPHQEPMVNTGAPEEETVPAPHVTPIVYMKSL
jgi:hypothetical protein